MMPIAAEAVYIKKEAAEDPRSMERINRMMPFVRCDTAPIFIDDDGWHQLVLDRKLNALRRHGTGGTEVEPVVVFNQFLYHHSPETRSERRRRYPALFRPAGTHDPYSGYGGWDWRKMGDEEYRTNTGLVCQPGYAMHSFWGCHFRCAYCNLGHVANIYVNVEDWVSHIEHGLRHLEKAPDQKLFQWDNGTDVVCWEPEYGATEMLVDLFARQSGKYLEVYVGKSDHVDFMLDYEHRGHTICCWSLGTERQCRMIEPRTAGMHARIAAARKCQEAGYTVRLRLSPMVPLVGWKEEVPEMLSCVFDEIIPDLITLEPLRYCTHQTLLSDFPAGSIDPEFMAAMAGVPDDADDWTQNEFPDDLRIRMYRLAIREITKRSPRTPIAFCREKRRVWDALADDLERLGQSPDDYVCNCGPKSAGCDPRLENAVH